MRLYLLDGAHVANQAFTDATGRIVYTTSTTKGVTTISRAVPTPRVRSESTTSSRTSTSSDSHLFDSTSSESSSSGSSSTFSPSPSRRSMSSLSSVSTAAPPTPRLEYSRSPTPVPLRMRSSSYSSGLFLLAQRFPTGNATVSRESVQLLAPSSQPTSPTYYSLMPSRSKLESQSQSQPSAGRMPEGGRSETTRKAPVAHVTQTRAVASLIWAPRRTRSVDPQAGKRFSNPDDASSCTMVKIGGSEASAAHVWKKPTNKKNSSKREWVAEDGRTYVWDVKWWKPRLTAAGSDTPIATFTRPFLAGAMMGSSPGILESRKAYLDIASEAEGMADMILTGFIYMEVTRQKKEGTSHA